MEHFLAAVKKLGTPVEVKKGETIFVEGTPMDSMFLVLTGQVFISVTGPDGRELMLDWIEPGRIFPLVGLLYGATHTASATAVSSRCKLLSIRAARLRPMLLSDSRICFCFLELALQDLRRRRHQLITAAFESAPSRVANWLLSIARKQHNRLHDGALISIYLPDRMVGLATAGLSRETVSRQFSRLVHDGIIQRSDKQIILLSIEKLETIAEGKNPI